MRIGLMVPALSPHDAVGNDVLGMYIALKKQGYDCTIFTANGETPYPIPVLRYDDAPLFISSPEDVIIYHYCFSEEFAIRILRNVAGRIVLKYHNLTPSQFMAPYSWEYAASCKRGRDTLRAVCELPLAGVINDSDYNARDIAQLLPPGVPMSTVAPMHRISELLGCADDPEMLATLDRNWFNIVAVGRVVPNKALDLMIPALVKLRDDGVTGVQLHIVGGRDPRLQSYISVIEALIADGGLGDAVTWHHSVSATKLATLYRHADLFWTVSQHEGFCVPVVEAMAFGLPVLSSRQGALPETCADAAVLADRTEEMARQLRRLTTDDALRAELSEKGLRRYRDAFRMARLEPKFIAALETIAANGDVQRPAADADWFGLPHTDALIGFATAMCAGTPYGRLATGDGRRQFIDWLIRVGRREAAEVAALLRSPDFVSYARELEVPEPAGHLSPPMRLAWHFDLAARSAFQLRNNPDVAAFLEWYEASAAADYGDLFSGSAPAGATAH